MLKQLTPEQKFYHFVCMKDPDERYDYRDMKVCACGQFLREVMGLELFKWGGDDLGGLPILALNHIACGNTHEDWTFGKLRGRLEIAMPECVV